MIIISATTRKSPQDERFREYEWCCGMISADLFISSVCLCACVCDGPPTKLLIPRRPMGFNRRIFGFVFLGFSHRIGSVWVRCVVYRIVYYAVTNSAHAYAFSWHSHRCHTQHLTDTKFCSQFCLSQFHKEKNETLTQQHIQHLQNQTKQNRRSNWTNWIGEPNEWKKNNERKNN